MSLPLLLALMPLLSCAPAEAPDEKDEPLAFIEVIAPRSRVFVLRATVPLPPGALAPGDEKSPFGIVSHATGEPVIPAQVEGVSRYPDGSWDVVQLVALVERGKSESTGDELRFAVVPAPHVPSRAHLPGEVLRKLLATPGQLVLRCRDVHGNLYTFDLLDSKEGEQIVRKAGRWLNQFRTAGVMMPTTEPDSPPRGGPPVPHMCGVLAWFSDYAGEEPLSLDLRVHNGLTAGVREPLPGEEPVGAIYWQSMELCVAAGITLVPKVEDPFFGEPYDDGEQRVWPIVAPFDDGTLHLMGPQAQFLRRLALVLDGSVPAARERLENRGLGFCAHSTSLWSWSNRETARYFPQRELLPSMDFYQADNLRGQPALRLHEAGRLAELSEQLRSGAAGPYPRISPVLGWAHPYFVSIGGSHGGEGITLVEGQRAVGGCSVESYSRLELIHRMNTSRQPVATWTRSGQPAGLSEWTSGAGEARSVPSDYRTNARMVLPPFHLPCRKGPPASNQVAEVARSGRRPPYDGGTPFAKDGKTPGADEHLLSWLPHDGQHWVRYTKNAKAMLWLGDDPTAEDDLQLFAELFRLYFHEVLAPERNWGGPVTLRQVEEVAADHPHRGLPIGREHAWGIDAFCAYYSTAEDPWRKRHLPWAQRVADLLVNGAPPGGVIIRSNHGPLLNNPKYVGAHSFQSQFLLLAQRSLCESALRGVDPERVAALEELYLRTVEYLFWGPVWRKVKMKWSSDENPVFEQGPCWAFAVALNDNYATPSFSDEQRWGKNYVPADGLRDGVETWYGYSSLSWAADLTQATHGRGAQNRYLRRTCEYGQKRGGYATVYRTLTEGANQPWSDLTGQAAGYLARLQELETIR
jgi:hypothetical protein